MKKYILLLCCLLFLPFVTSGQNIGDIRDVFLPVAIPKSGLPSWLNSDWSPIFNGVNQYAQIGVVYRQNATDPITIMFWTKPSSYPSTYSEAFRIHYGNFPLVFYGAGIMRNANAGYYSLSQPLASWSHMAVAIPGNSPFGSSTAYVNGAAYTGILYGIPDPNPIFIPSSTWVFGGQGGKFGNLSLSEFSIWNRALSQSEILRYKDKRLKGSEQGLVALYHMNEGPGNASQTLVDSVGGKNATCYGSVQWTKRNGFQPPDVRAASMALSLDGVDDYASATASNLPATASARTVMGWFFDADPTTTSYKCLFSYGTSSNGTLFGCLFKSNELHFGIALNTFKIAYTHNSKWTHYAFTLPSGGTLSDTSIYLDGVLASGSRTLVEGSLSTLVNTNAASGSFWVSSWIGSLPVKGKNGEWSLWNRALSQSEIQQYMYQSLTGSETGLVRYYKFNEGSGSTVKDYASGHYDATLYNSPTWIGRDIP